MTPPTRRRSTTTSTTTRRKWLLAALSVTLVAGAVIGVAWFVRSRPAPSPPLPPRWPVVVTTFARGSAPVSGADPAAHAGFSEPFGIAVSPTGRVFASDGERNAIYRIRPDGSAAVFVGGREGFDDGDSGAASFRCPSGLAMFPSGVLVVADTGNHAIRLVIGGRVTTLAGDGAAGSDDGVGRAARFNGPIGVAAASDGSVWVTDTYNDRIRKIAPGGRVTTVAGGAGAGYRDGAASDALFDTPTGIAVAANGDVFVADTGNNVLRRISPSGEVTTIAATAPAGDKFEPAAALFRPVGLAISGGYLYATDASRVVVFPPDGAAGTLAGGIAGFADGPGDRARLRGPTGIGVDDRGIVWVADSDNDLVRRLTPPGVAVPSTDIDLDPTPLLTPRSLQLPRLPWPFAPQDAWHELAATLGEARGSRGGDASDRLHNGIDIRGEVGDIVLAVRDEMVQRPIAAGPFDDPSEGLRTGVVSYVHVRVGRDRRGRSLDPDRFSVASDEDGKPIRVRVKRGARFRAGDPIGTVNRLAHVHLDIGPRGAEVNPLAFGLADFRDTIPPVIRADGIDLYDESGGRVTARRNGRVVASGRVSVVAEAFDRVDGNAAGRRLGVYAIGYQVLGRDGTPAPGFEEPRTAIQFDRLPAEPEAAKLAYADGSGITVYGNRVTRFRYIVTNRVGGGEAAGGMWDTALLPPGNYTLRVTAADLAGNTATRDLAVTIVERR